MTKIETLTSIARQLSDEQLTGMLEYASYLSSDRSLFDTLNDDAKAGVLEGLAELNRGEGIPIERHDMMRRKRLSAAVS